MYVGLCERLCSVWACGVCVRVRVCVARANERGANPHARLLPENLRIRSPDQPPPRQPWVMVWIRFYSYGYGVEPPVCPRDVRAGESCPKRTHTNQYARVHARARARGVSGSRRSVCARTVSFIATTSTMTPRTCATCKRSAASGSLSATGPDLATLLDFRLRLLMVRADQELESLRQSVVHGLLEGAEDGSGSG